MRRVSENRPGGSYGRARTALCAVAACWFLPLTPAVAAQPSPSAPPPSPGARAAAPTAVPEPAGGVPRAAEGADPRTPDSADLAVSGVLRPGVSGDREQREGAASAVRETFDYVVTVTNRGPSTARQVRVTDRLPASLEFVSSRDGCTARGTTVVCGPLDTLPVGASHAWVITVRLAADYRGDGADIVNEAVVDAATSDPDSHNNTTSLTGLKVPISARTADLSLRKTAQLAKGREHVRPGEKFTYLISVHNQGPGTARQVTVTDLLPSSLTLLSSPDDCELERGQDRRVVCPPLPRLAAGETAEFRITVLAGATDRANPPASICTPLQNVARVASASFDPDPSDNANAPDTTGPHGGRLCLISDGGKDHHGDDGDGDDGDDGDGGDDGRDDAHGGHEDHGGRGEHGREDQHGGRGDLADSGAAVPQWLLWASASLVAGGAALRTASRTRSRT
ncbi:hypothetical protein ACFWAR_16055 [Streptomyces sp. NPDC059917]|uniref:hypothetical protein n=1 Tax=Streptomyces sp. NPDC059917 TaxID=3347002 RepID=UPI0036460433